MTEHDRQPEPGSDGPGGDDVDSLLGAFALDAVDDVERRRVERRLEADPELRAEADRLVVAADHLAAAAAGAGPTAPADLWGRIAARLDHGAPAPADLPAPAGDPRPAGDVVVPIGRSRRRTARLVAAAAAVLLLVAGSVAVGSRLGQDDTDPMVAMRAAAEKASEQPGSRSGELVDADATMGVPVVVDAEGHAFVMTEQLPALPSGETYQLWSVDGGTPVSLGLVGTDSPMTMVGVDGRVTRLALTIEPAGGSAVPTTPPMASGTLTEV
jgi:anti-sigma-K factor RskA